MTDPQHACATDKEIFDVLMGAKNRFTESVLLDIAKTRGIFYSGHDSRMSLASSISLLPHGFRNLMSLLQQRETGTRGERVTHVSLQQAVDIDRIKEIALQYQSDAPHGEKVVCIPQGNNAFTVSVQYSEIDYSKTRLIQRREKEADIEFTVEGERTTIRMPANDKAMSIALDLQTRLDQSLPTKIPHATIDLSDLTDSQQRSEFFTSLISSMAGFRLRTVTNLKIQRRSSTDNPTDLDDDYDHSTEEWDFRAVVESVALRGQGLHTTPEYQDFRTRGFYISLVTWRAEQVVAPNHLVEFEACFDDPNTCKNFQYKVRGVSQKHKDKHAKTFKPPELSDRVAWLALIEATAHSVLKQVRETTIESGE